MYCIGQKKLFFTGTLVIFLWGGQNLSHVCQNFLNKETSFPLGKHLLMCKRKNKRISFPPSVCAPGTASAPKTSGSS